MILAIDIGNTNIVIGCMDGKKCVFIERLSTVRTKTELEYAIDIKNVLDIYHNPAQLGSDLVVDSVAAIAEYPVPLLVFDMGTANTVCVIDKNKNYIGGMIYPGIGVSLDSLTANASQLGGISLEAPEHIIGKNTVECMKSGTIYSAAAAIDGIIDRLAEELDGDVTVVATGGLAGKIVPHCRREIRLDEDLLLKGLAVIYQKNQR